MAAERVAEILRSTDWELLDLDGLKDLFKTVLGVVQTEIVKDPIAGEKTKIHKFNDKHVGKPKPWNGDVEE